MSNEITPNTPNPVREDAYKQQLAAKLGIDPKYIPGSPIWHSEEEIAAIAEMFSNMAGGSSGGGVLVVTETDGTLNKTWQEIHDAMAVGQIPVVGYVDGNDAGITLIGWGAFLDDAYSLWPVGANISQDDPWYRASSASGYPTSN